MCPFLKHFEIGRSQNIILAIWKPYGKHRDQNQVSYLYQLRSQYLSIVFFIKTYAPPSRGNRGNIIGNTRTTQHTS